MNYSFFLIPILLIGFISFAYAEIEQGINYNKEIIQTNPDGSPRIIKQTLLSYDRILDNTTYKDYIFSDVGSSLEVKTATKTIHLDKTTCGYSFYNSDNVFLFNDSILAFQSVVDQYTWNAVISVNDAICEAYFDEPNNALVAKKYSANVGFMEYKYIFDRGILKTQLEATNLSTLTNRVFAFDQTIDLNRDMIKFGGINRNLDNFDGQSFSRTFLENNQAKVLDFLNGFNFDFDLGFDYLDSITVTDTGANKSKLTFHYMRNNEILLPGETLIIDPTFAYTAGTVKSVSYVGAMGNTSCVDGSPTTDTTASIDRGRSAVAATCRVTSFQWDTSSIPDSSIITNVNWRIDIDIATTPVNCDVKAMSQKPSDITGATLWTEILDGDTEYVSNDNFCVTTGNQKTFDLGATADTDLQALLSADWFAVGMRYFDMTRDATNRLSTFSDAELEVTYTTPSNFEVNDLIIENVGDAFSTTGNYTINQGFLVNVTSIVYSVNGTIITTNSTGQNTTSYPTTISFGPFYYQQITDSIYNHTVTVNIQDSFGTNSNNTSSLLTREYDPDYFTALDPAEGLVNYTFVGTNTINVNRDTGGSVFNIECSYLSHSQAFFNDLASGTWDNKTNVIFYEGDTTGSAYIACFNDGELFVIGINQSYSNAIIPGLLIFDQLGGFFGAPSIILVILSILSLGTGRNYPIIMLIAAAVTGILLALELLTLDPGLVVALIVMTGFGLFGIRKFY